MADAKPGVEDFIAKLDWEGVDYAAFEYGLKSSDYDLPLDLAESWDRFVEMGDVRMHLIDVLYRYGY